MGDLYVEFTNFGLRGSMWFTVVYYKFYTRFVRCRDLDFDRCR